MTGPKSDNPPIKHHYIPAFYLSRWKGPDGRLCEYSQPHIEIAVKRRAPDATGFEKRLYELEGYEPALAQQVEEKFFKPVDGWAADSSTCLSVTGIAPRGIATRGQRGHGSCCRCCSDALKTSRAFGSGGAKTSAVQTMPWKRNTGRSGHRMLRRHSRSISQRGRSLRSSAISLKSSTRSWTTRARGQDQRHALAGT